ncbi:HAMP domain-containing sensor histidine kinase [Minwuia sp. IMCC3060]|uniref:sensor histidine kinase n=1 Tax=Minwuia sp. IMCC3060 TaxID=3040675 RepID=UPI002479881D|nr:HAMP domain-containing sensor histidine kinase [Minwuia sp. IMCC3060]
MKSYYLLILNAYAKCKIVINLSIFVIFGIISVNILFYIYEVRGFFSANEESAVWHATQIEYDALKIADLSQRTRSRATPEQEREVSFYFQSIRSRLDASSKGLIRKKFSKFPRAEEFIRKISESLSKIELRYNNTYYIDRSNGADIDNRRIAFENFLRLCRQFSSYSAVQEARLRDEQRSIGMTFAGVFIVSGLSILILLFSVFHSIHQGILKEISAEPEKYLKKMSNSQIGELISGFIYNTPVKVVYIDDIEGSLVRSLSYTELEGPHIMGVQIDSGDEFDVDPALISDSVQRQKSWIGTLRITRSSEARPDEFFMIKISEPTYGKFRYICMIIDVTTYEIERMNHQKRESLLSMGELAGSLAHEISQPINNIGLLTSNLRASLSNLDAPSVRLKKIESQIDRCRKIIGALQSLSSGQLRDIEQIDVRIIMENWRNGYRHRNLQGVRMIVRCCREECLIDFNSIILSEVLSNLVDNALDQLDRHPPSYPVVLICCAPHGDHVRIEIWDNAGGVQQGLERRIFEPFVSTKHNHGGTGLGLTVARKFIRQADGELSFRRRKNGSIFTIDLPRSMRVDGQASLSVWSHEAG